MIRRALGLGLLILILKFLANEVFVAGEDAAVNMLNTASVLFSKVGNSSAEVLDVSDLIPH